MSLPNTFRELIHVLDKKYNFKCILFVNTSTTGRFLDSIFLGDRVLRIKYSCNKYNDFVETINRLGKKFDLICIDPYHEYKESIDSFRLLTTLLDDDGILISHDCSPPNFSSASYVYKQGEWCGVTYAAFIEMAHSNPNWYYAVINKDYGLGIISKKETQFVKKLVDSEKQQIFLDMFRGGKYEEAYNYFINHSLDIINLIN